MKLTLIAELIKVAGHDIGHFPLSHAFEEQVFQTHGAHGAHEIIGQRLMLENPEIQSVLSSISDDLLEVLSSLYSHPVLNFPAYDESSYDVNRLDYVSLYSEIFDIAEDCPDSNIRQLATLTIPKLDSFFNILYFHLDCKNTHSYSSEDLQFLSHIKSLLKGNSSLIRDLTNPDFLNDNIVFLTHSPLKDDLSKRGLISSFSYKFKTYNPNEPVYVEDETSRFVELSNSPNSTIDLENSRKLFKYDFAYVPFLRFKGLSDTEISNIRASGVRPDIKTSKSVKVNMSPLIVEHNVRDYFKNMDIDER